MSTVSSIRIDDAISVLKQIREFLGEYAQKMDNPRCAAEMRELWAKTEMVLTGRPLPIPWDWIANEDNRALVAAVSAVLDTI